MDHIEEIEEKYALRASDEEFEEWYNNYHYGSKIMCEIVKERFSNESPE